MLAAIFWFFETMLNTAAAIFKKTVYVIVGLVLLVISLCFGSFLLLLYIVENT